MIMYFDVFDDNSRHVKLDWQAVAFIASCDIYVTWVVKSDYLENDWFYQKV